ncbi:MAG: thermonuclease family protein [Methylococcales bacterium]|nr:thermonuclease family protein [Methylococcales bacterium]
MFFLLLILILTPLSVQAEVFQWTDNNGNKHYSDTPHQGATKLHFNTGYSYYQVKKVYDGDTILLSNGNKIRFLGMNTPEVENRHKSAQAGGEEAKLWLQKALKNKKVRLEKDIEKHDKYNRLLAHLFTKDKQHINLELIKRGLATVNIHPPNLKYSNDLIKAQQHAEQNKLGVWQRKEYIPKQTSKLNRSNYKGWQRIKGEVTIIRYTRKYIYLKFSESFSLKISQQTIDLFPDLNSYIGKQIEARGWINKQKKKYIMFIRHPSQIYIK